MRYVTPVFCSVLLLASWSAIQATAQSTNAQTHVAAARAAAYEPGHDFTGSPFDLCAEPTPPPARPVAAPAAADPNPQFVTTATMPPRSVWYTEPQKVFDNLYYVGDSRIGNHNVWAVTTSAGIILINSGTHYTVEELIVNGLKKMGLDPGQIKYVIVNEGEPEAYGGAKLLQDRYKARVLLSEADWDVMARADVPAEIKPRKDMVVTDGQKLTLGDVTVTLYLSPGHTPGTVSMLISPLKDGNQRHVGSVFGGRGAEGVRPVNGVQYYRTDIEAMRLWSASAKRFKGIAESAGADVFLSLHHSWDKTLDKLYALKFRQPGDPHTLVSKTAVARYQTVISECMDAQLAWRSGK
jgi:metallo-beta-lactamase class B